MNKTTVLVATILVVLVAMSTQGLCQEDGIDACYKRANGQLRIEDDPDSCRPSELPISLVSREEFEALVDRVEALEEGEPKPPCVGDNCCETPADCDKFTQDPICINPIACQGTRMDATCIDNTCDSKSVDDDSACDETVEALDCGLYATVYCNGNVDQTAPSCLNSCTLDDDCVAGASCEGIQCELQFNLTYLLQGRGL